MQQYIVLLNSNPIKLRQIILFMRIRLFISTWYSFCRVQQSKISHCYGCTHTMDLCQTERSEVLFCTVGNQQHMIKVLPWPCPFFFWGGSAQKNKSLKHPLATSSKMVFTCATYVKMIKTTKQHKHKQTRNHQELFLFDYHSMNSIIKRLDRF